MVRIDDDDEVYRTAAEKYRAILNLIDECKERAQPVLVGTTSIEKSEQLAEMLRQQGWEQDDFADPNAFAALYSGDDGASKAKVFAILNARYHEQAAYIIGQAGVPRAVTIRHHHGGAPPTSSSAAMPTCASGRNWPRSKTRARARPAGGGDPRPGGAAQREGARGGRGRWLISSGCWWNMNGARIRAWSSFY